MKSIIFNYLSMGEKNAIPAKELAILCGFTSIRKLQQHIETLRNRGYVICSTCQDGGGYFIHENKHELGAFIRTVENRAFNSLKSIIGAKKSLEEFENAE